MHDLIPLAIVIAIEPLPVVGFIIVLSTDRGARNGAGFIVGWLSCIVAIVVGTILLTGGEPPAAHTVPSTATNIVTLLIGLGLLGFAYYRLRIRPPPSGVRPPPSWTAKLDEMRPPAAALVGVLLQPWPLVAAAATSIVQVDLSSTEAVIEVVLFCVLATSSLLAMEIFYLVDRDAAVTLLERLRNWIEHHRDRAITILALVVGAWMAVKGCVGLVP